MSKNSPVDMVKLIDFQSREQYRTILVLGPAGSGKTRYAKLLAHAAKAKYIDLLDDFSKDKSLSENIDLFNVPNLKRYLLDLQLDESVVIVDNIDFLLNTWTDHELSEFLNLVEKLRSNETKKTFCFFAQDLKILSAKLIYNSQNNSRVIALDQVAHIREEDNDKN
jgi:adenosyl cobinamide kinase/adenosyl cobinamide phosphate guanylyltransferase